MPLSKDEPHTQFPGALETNPESNAYVKEFKDFPVYFQGCLWGGKVPEVIDMVKELDRRTKEDLSKDIVAVWHDESHLNKFYIDNFESVNILGPEFAYPEVFSGYCEFEPRIIHLAKDNSKISNMKKLDSGIIGCKIELVNNQLIRKYSSSTQYNSRLSKQIDKQVLFSKLYSQKY